MNEIELIRKIEQQCNVSLYEKGFVCSIDILIGLNYLTQDQLTDWRFGRIEYLEKVCSANLKKLTLVNKTMRVFAREKKLNPSFTAYYKHGKGNSTNLIFSKTKDEKIETHYKTHFLDIKRINELKERSV